MSRKNSSSASRRSSVSTSSTYDEYVPVDDLNDILKESWEQCEKYILPMWGQIADSLSEYSGAVVEVTTMAWSTMLSAIKAAWLVLDTAIKTVKRLKNKSVHFVSDQVIDGMLQGFKTARSAMFDALIEALHAVRNATKHMVAGPVWNAFHEALIVVWDAVHLGVGKAWDTSLKYFPREDTWFDKKEELSKEFEHNKKQLVHEVTFQ